MLAIKLEDVNRTTHGPLFLGARSRLATATAVCLLDAQRLVVASLVARRLYLVDFDLDAGTWQVVHELPTTFQGEEVTVDLIDHDGHGAIVTSNCENDSISYYRLAGDRLEHVRDLPLDDPQARFCHGVRFVPPAGELICATCIHGDRAVYFLSRATGELVYGFSHGDWVPRDACFASERRLIVPYSLSHPSSTPDDTFREVEICLFDLDIAGGQHALLDSVLLPDAQADGCVYRDGRVYVTDQVGDSVIVLQVDGDRLAYSHELSGYNFPHGVDMLPDPGLLAVTNYGDNTVVVTRL